MSRHIVRIFLALIFFAGVTGRARAQESCPLPPVPAGAEAVANSSLTPAQLPPAASSALHNAVPAGFRVTAVYELALAPPVYVARLDNCCALPATLTESRALVLEPAAGGRYRAMPVLEKTGRAATLAAPAQFYRRGPRAYFLSMAASREFCFEGLIGRAGQEYVLLPLRRLRAENPGWRAPMDFALLERFVAEPDAMLPSGAAGDGATELAARFVEAVLRGDAEALARLFPPNDRVFLSNDAEDRRKTIRLARLLLGFEDQWEIVNDFAGRFDVQAGQGYASDAALSGQLGQTRFGEEALIEFRRAGRSDVLAVLHSSEGQAPWFVLEMEPAGSGWAVRNAVSLAQRKKVATPLREFLRGGGEYAQLRRQYFGDAPAGAAAASPLPEQIRRTLDVVCPGWRFAEYTGEVNDFFRQQKRDYLPYLLPADFDGDGRLDYAVHVWQPTPGGEQRLVLAFLERGAEYEMHVLEKLPGTDANIYLELYRRGQRGFDYERQRAFTFLRHSVGVSFFEKAGVAYQFEGGRFRKIIVSD
jgi:hypothetical protein